MNSKKIFFIFFGLIILLVPVYLIFSSENVLENGHLHKLQLRGYDPFDPFRGKYLRLNYDNSAAATEEFKEGETVYVTFKKDSLGFSDFDQALKTKPAHDDYMTSTVTGSSFFWDMDEKFVTFELDNLTKYFINEDLASEAEEVVLHYQRERPADIYVAIRVLDGEARLEDIYVEETPLLEFLEK